MQLIFEYQKKRIILPVNPENLRINKPSNAQKVNVVGLGQVAIPQNPDLTTISIKSFFWGYLFDTEMIKRLALKGVATGIDKFSGYVGGRLAKNQMIAEGYSKEEVDKAYNEVRNERTPTTSAGNLTGNDADNFESLNEYIDWFEKWQLSKKPARFSVISTPFEPKKNCDLFVTCESFSYETRAGEENDYYYELELLEWKNISANELVTNIDENGNLSANKNNGNKRISNKEIPEKITMTSKDTLWSVSKKYGNGETDDWKKFYNTGNNKEIIANKVCSEDDYDIEILTPEEFNQKRINDGWWY